MRYFFILLLGFLIWSDRSAYYDDEERFFKTLSEVQLEADMLSKPGEFRSALTSASSSKGRSAFESAFRLWRADRFLELEVAWMRQSDSDSRIVIVALFYTQVGDPDLSVFPPFHSYASRFASAEKEARQKEIEWVFRKKAQLKSKIDSLAKK